MTAAPRGFAALSNPAFRRYFGFSTLAIMSDNVEHVISYWVVFQKFHSPALGAFAVISHWVPHLLFAAYSGTLADRLDLRRLIQVGMLMLMGVSIGWGIVFQDQSVELWKVMLLLVVHGSAGVIWLPASQVLIHQLVEAHDLPSAVRLNASSRYVGFLIGPAVGAALLLALGPTRGIWVNALLYAPMIIWVARVPRLRRSAPRAAVRGFADLLQGVKVVARVPVLLSMTVMIAIVSFFVGNAYQAQMPGFATSLGHARADFLYSVLLAADAGGGLIAAIVMERRMGRAAVRTAFLFAILWSLLLMGFALSHTYWLSVSLLFCAGFTELVFNAMSQTLVQLHAPPEMRGRVIGVFTMAALGFRAFSGLSVGLLGERIGIHGSLGFSAGCVFVGLCALWLFRRVHEQKAPV